MKKMITTAIITLTIMASILTPTKKADAAVIVVATGVGGIALGLPVLLLGGIGGLFLVVDASICFDPSYMCDKEKAKNDILLGLGLVALDVDQVLQASFKSVPTYLLDEVYAQARVKAELIEANKNGMKSVTFTDAEVEEIFTLADDFTLKSELNELKEMLQSPVDL